MSNRGLGADVPLQPVFADEAGACRGSSAGSFVAGSEFSSLSYEPAANAPCRRLRRLRDTIVETPSCLGCTICFAATAVGFFVLEAWWFRVMYWPGYMEAAVAAAPVVLQRRFQRLGCYPLTPGDGGAPPPGSSAVTYNEACMARMPEGQLCRSGLPWYSFQLGDGTAPTWRLCAEFCLLKGLDISGSVDGTECRCGASPVVAEEMAAGRPDLAWQAPEAQVSDDSDQCRIVAAQYLGIVPIPESELDVSSTDLTYVESVARGAEVELEDDVLVPLPSDDQEAGEDFDSSTGDGNASQDLGARTPEEPQQFQDDDGQLRLRPCFPQQCAAGLPWPIWTTYSEGIPYAFHPSVGELTRQAFRKAVAAYHAATCVLLSEVSVGFHYALKILVMSTSSGCWTRPLGYPVVYHRDTEINLGWCSGEREVGNMIHELGHALGMAHEQTRPDRDQFVHIDAQNLTPTGQKQFAVDHKAYMGSERSGFEPYDYGSLMHYPASAVMKTLPIVNGHGVHDGEVGQRQGLSRLDVRQLRNMYMCDTADAFEDSCVDIDEGLGEALSFRGIPAQCVQVAPKYCEHHKYGEMIMYFCRRSCDNCPREPEGDGHGAHAPSDVDGCEDASPFCARYAAYCPGGSLQGNEQWMSQNCRDTCHIERYCGPAEEEPDEEDIVAPAPSKPCIDSDATGLLNVLGRTASCAQLVERCWDTEVGGQVRSACPASCGQCEEVEDQVPEWSTASVRLVFVVGGGAYDLSDSSDRSTLTETLTSQLSQLYGHALEATVSAGDSCEQPCRKGSANVKGDCCVQATLDSSCTITCTDLSTTLQRYDAPELTAKFLSMGLAGLLVQRVEEPRSMSGVLSAVFMTGKLKLLFFGLGVASVVFMLFACSACPCCERRGRPSPLQGVLLEGETDSDDA